MVASAPGQGADAMSCEAPAFSRCGPLAMHRGTCRGVRPAFEDALNESRRRPGARGHAHPLDLRPAAGTAQMLKRQMFGRAGFALLRKRVLLAS